MGKYNLRVGLLTVHLAGASYLSLRSDGNMTQKSDEWMVGVGIGIGNIHFCRCSNKTPKYSLRPLNLRTEP